MPEIGGRVSVEAYHFDAFWAEDGLLATLTGNMQPSTLNAPSGKFALQGRLQ